MSIFSQDTIAAFATAPSSGAVALLRISGGGAFKALAALTNNKNFKDRQATLTKIYDGSDVLDSALALTFQGPKSYTGEDVAELPLHASPYIKSRILEILVNLNVRPAKPGEFTMRAFLNGKMDLTEAQGVADIIASKNKAAHKAAMNSLEGKLSARFKKIKEDLTDLLAQVEVRIDDSDEEMQALDAAQVNNLLEGITQQTAALAGTFSTGKMVKDGVKAAIVGVPNSGKSSLLNALLGFDRAIVSPVSGTTRDTIEASFNAHGFTVVLTDTAGIREHSLDPAEKEGMQRSRRAVKSADIVIFVKDINAKTPQQDLFDDILKEGKNIITVVNKADLLAPGFKEEGAVLISCKTGSGVEDLKNKIVEVLSLSALQEDDILITSAAHYEALINAGRELHLAKQTAADLELMAEHIRRALHHLKELIGEVTADNVLDVIFSKFCVGK